jgi:hypothetical protein
MYFFRYMGLQYLILCSFCILPIGKVPFNLEHVKFAKAYDADDLLSKMLSLITYISLFLFSPFLGHLPLLCYQLSESKSLPCFLHFFFLRKEQVNNFHWLLRLAIFFPVLVILLVELNCYFGFRIKFLPSHLRLLCR